MTRLAARLGIGACILLGLAAEARASELLSVAILDQDYLLVHFRDGEVIHDEVAVGEYNEVVNRFTPELDTSAAASTSSWTITSSDDSNYDSGQHPQSCYRKKKLNGHAQLDWVGGDYAYEYTYDHWIYLELPSSLQPGATYTLSIAGATNSSDTSAQVTFDLFDSRSEAVHVNLVGYLTDAPHKAADLYYWMGDGGARDYSSFEGHEVFVYDVVNDASVSVGTVTFGAANASEEHGHNYTQSPVWHVDFSSVTAPGTYRLAIEGVGCSQDFIVGDDAYHDPFQVSLQGFFYMRLGDMNPNDVSPPPRSPSYIPGTDPTSTTVVLTTMHPFHAQYGSMECGDCWDAPDEWAPYAKAGNPTNPDAWGGYADAADLDRHLGHVPIIWDLLLPYILTEGALDDDDMGIGESGNGIPDVIDSAAWETDFWLRLRDPDDGSYSHGLTNPNDSDTLYQADGTAISAWANAVNAAMLAEAFRIAGRTPEMESYRDAAVEAYDIAGSSSDPMLDDDANLAGARGRDLKMTAAAYLFNVTGDAAYEDVVFAESNCADDPNGGITEVGSFNQVWATAGYLTTPQAVNYPTLQENMRAAIVAEAMSAEAGELENRPSRRTSYWESLWFQTVVDVNRSIVAHAVVESQADRDYLLKALALEADWTLGRNPLNIIQMSTPSSVLASKRNMDQIYYWEGLEDGIPGTYPGLTPYVNLALWGGCGMTMSCPPRLYEDGYPVDVENEWPFAESYFPTPWVYVHTEFTPQQTMRGKTALYGYLHALAGEGAENPEPALSVRREGSGSGSVSSAPEGIDCGTTCSAVFSVGTSVTLTATADVDHEFDGWSGACTGISSTCTVTMVSAPQLVTATFTDPNAPATGGSGATGGSPTSGGTGASPASGATGGSPASGATGGSPASGATGGSPASGGTGGSRQAGGSGGSGDSGGSRGIGGAAGSGDSGDSGDRAGAGDGADAPDSGSSKDSGCGCVTARRSPRSAVLLGALALMLLGLRRRQRSAGRRSVLPRSAGLLTADC
ncbi:MAG: glycoside hydrolase family 9 protein [Polyangiaceae bacterium]|nr:glycoside hydrolase family 9 protein [Polyangiaceae bacterium]